MKNGVRVGSTMVGGTRIEWGPTALRRFRSEYRYPSLSEVPTRGWVEWDSRGNLVDLSVGADCDGLVCFLGFLEDEAAPEWTPQKRWQTGR